MFLQRQQMKWRDYFVAIVIRRNMLRIFSILLSLILLFVPQVSYAANAEVLDFLISGFTDNSGNALNGGKVYTYSAGTTTNKTTWTDSTKSTPAANPIILDSNGRAQIYGDGNYKFVIKTSGNTTLYTFDNMRLGRGINFYDVKDYGAVGDGTTDDTTAVSNALATGGAVYFPKGTYLISSITLTTAKQRLYGEGRTSIIKHSTANSNLFTVQADDVVFENLTFYGAATSDITTEYAIFTASANPADRMTIKNCVFTGASSGVGFNSGIKFDANNDYGRVEGSFFERLYGSVDGTGYAILSGDVDGLVITNNNFIGGSGRGRHAIYFSAGASNCIADGNYIYGFDYQCISQYSAGVQPSCKQNIYSNNTLINCALTGNATSGAININGHSDGALVIGNTIYNSGAKGIAVDGTDVTDLKNTTIEGNFVQNSQTIGIDTISVINANIVGNTVNNSSQASSNGHANFRIVGDGVTASTNVLVTGNHSSFTANTRSSLQLNATSPAPVSVKVSGNLFPTMNLDSIELNGVTAKIDGRIQFSGTWDAASVADGDAVSNNFTVSGAVAGDTAIASYPGSVSGLGITAHVSATDTVTVTLLNNTGGAVDLASGTWKIDVFKRDI